MATIKSVESVETEDRVFLGRNTATPQQTHNPIGDSMRTISLVTLLLLSTVVHGADLAKSLKAGPPLSVPEEVKGEAGAYVVITATTEGKSVRFVPLDAGLSVFPAELLISRKATVVVGLRAGKYRVLVYSAVADEPTEPAICTVIIGKPSPTPEPEPEETEAMKLTALIKAAYATESVEEKSALPSLRKLYATAGVVTDTETVTTWGKLYEAMGAEAKTLTLSGKMAKTQAPIAVYLRSISPKEPNSDAPLTDADKTKLKVAFARISKALEELK